MDPEAKRLEALRYLNTPGKEKYIAICSYLYSSYLTGHHFRTFHEVFDAYRKERGEAEQVELHNLLDKLYGWGNVVKRPNYYKAKTVEEIANKSNDYALSETGVQVMRFALELARPVPEPKVTNEDIELLMEQLKRMREELEAGRVEGFARQWQFLMDTFNRLHHGAVRYYTVIGSADIEDRMVAAGEERSLEFYRSLKDNVEAFAGTLSELQPQISREICSMDDGGVLHEMLYKAAGFVAKQELDADADAIYKDYSSQWDSLSAYFVPREADEYRDGRTECQKVFAATINALAGFYAVFLRRFREKDTASGLARKYQNLMGAFAICDGEEESQRLLATVFGALRSRHLCIESSGGEDNGVLPYNVPESFWTYEGVVEEILPLTKRGRKPRQKPSEIRLPPPEFIREHERRVEERRAAEAEVIGLLAQGQFTLSELPKGRHGRAVRLAILGWWASALKNPGVRDASGTLVPERLVAPTRYGPRVKFTPKRGPLVEVEFEDGTLRIKDMEVEVLGDE
ncbi:MULTISPECIES: DUF2397 family protein [Sporomusa]|uniref:DUF2397 family protein n=1 Tax=Sporomusa TaxID=2375 RepID=UPI00166CBA68|nr:MULTISPECIES: DUF2397 family protein [Sporomusa]MCM0759093.1 DUF2397 domain-containing protein [Sporomusa sphaeroides DSM 2875]